MVLNESIRLNGTDELYFSYGQFLAYDANEPEPGSLWTEMHVQQGFVRRPHALAFGTLLDHGTAALRVFLGNPESLDDYVRVVSVPIDLTSGTLCIEGPEEYPIERWIALSDDQYRLVVAQSYGAKSRLSIDLYVELTGRREEKSAVLKMDESLRIVSDLLETGDVAP
jgi:hypothetical protein